MFLLREWYNIRDHPFLYAEQGVVVRIASSRHASLCGDWSSVVEVSLGLASIHRGRQQTGGSFDANRIAATPATSLRIRFLRKQLLLCGSTGCHVRMFPGLRPCLQHGSRDRSPSGQPAGHWLPFILGWRRFTSEHLGAGRILHLQRLNSGRLLPDLEPQRKLGAVNRYGACFGGVSLLLDVL